MGVSGELSRKSANVWLGNPPSLAFKGRSAIRLLREFAMLGLDVIWEKLLFEEIGGQFMEETVE